MEEKERKQLKKRLLGLVINEPPYPYPITMAEVMVNDMSKPNLKPLLNFIEQELDKAREEGKLEVLEELLEWDTPLEPIGKFMRLQTKMVEMKRDLLNLLKTKEDGK